MKWLWFCMVSFAAFTQTDSTNEIRKISQLREEFLWSTNAYPNPSAGDVIFEGLPGSFIDVKNEFGQLIITFQLDQTGKLEMQGMNPGTYILRFRTEDECLLRRLVVN